MRVAVGSHRDVRAPSARQPRATAELLHGRTRIEQSALATSAREQRESGTIESFERIHDESGLRQLVQSEAEHRVSLYVPFERAPTELHADVLRVRGAAEQAAERLRTRGLVEGRIGALLAGVDLDEAALRALGSSDRGLVLLGSEEGWWLATTASSVEALVRVGERFALRPLLRRWALGSRFRLLAVSANRVAAWEGDAFGLQALDTSDLPTSLEAALGHELRGGDGMSLRADRPVPGQRAGGAVFHGHGGAPDERETDRERFLTIVGRAVTDAWKQSPLPVVIAAEERTDSGLRKHLELPRLLEEGVRGSPDDRSDSELHEAAWPLVRASQQERERRLAEGFERARAAGKAEPGDLPSLVQSAVAGRVRRLWIEQDARHPGGIDEAAAGLTGADDPEEDALDGLVELVLRRVGEVHVVDAGETPTGEPACAELR